MTSTEYKNISCKISINKDEPKTETKINWNKFRKSNLAKGKETNQVYSVGGYI